MVKGRAGLYLEAWKFSVYLGIPIFASVYFSDPETQKYWADYWQFIKYPENPNTNVKEKIRELVKEKERTLEQHKAYQEQLRQLQLAADRSKTFDHADVDDDSNRRPSWWSRIGGWVTGRRSAEDGTTGASDDKR